MYSAWLSDLYRYDGLISHCLRLSQWNFRSDLLDDCRQEILLVLWRMQPKIEKMPDSARQAYVEVAIRHAIWTYLRREIRHEASCVQLGDLLSNVKDGGLISAMASDQGEAVGLLGQVKTGALYDELLALNTRDYIILDMFYAEMLTDIEIAEHLEASVAAIKMRRTRLSKKLRRVLLRNCSAKSTLW